MLQWQFGVCDIRTDSSRSGCTESDMQSTPRNEFNQGSDEAGARRGRCRTKVAEIALHKVITMPCMFVYGRSSMT